MKIVRIIKWIFIAAVIWLLATLFCLAVWALCGYPPLN